MNIVSLSVLCLLLFISNVTNAGILNSDKSGHSTTLKLIDIADKKEKEKEVDISNDDIIGAVEKVNDRVVEKQVDDDVDIHVTAEAIESEIVKIVVNEELEILVIDDFEDYPSYGGLYGDRGNTYDGFKKNIALYEYMNYYDKITIERMMCNWEKTKCLINFCTWYKKIKTSCGNVIDYDGKVRGLYGITIEEETLDMHINESSQLQKLDIIGNAEKEEEDIANDISNKDVMDAAENLNDREEQNDGNDDEDMHFTVDAIECEVVNGKDICLVEICRWNKESKNKIFNIVLRGVIDGEGNYGPNVIEICKWNQEANKTSCNIVLSDAVDKRLHDVINVIANGQETIESDSREELQIKDGKSIENTEREKEIRYNTLSDQDNMAAKKKENDIEEKENHQGSLFEGNNDDFEDVSITERCKINEIKGSSTCLLYKSNCFTKICKGNKETMNKDCKTIAGQAEPFNSEKDVWVTQMCERKNPNEYRECFSIYRRPGELICRRYA